MTYQNVAVGGAFNARAAGIARIVMGACFVVFGTTKLLNVVGTTRFIGTHMPMPSVVFWLAVIIEVGLGLAVMLGYKARIAAALLALYCLFIAFVFHAQFGVSAQRDQFLKNFLIAGGFTYVAALGAGAFALENQRNGTRRTVLGRA